MAALREIFSQAIDDGEILADVVLAEAGEDESEGSPEEGKARAAIGSFPKSRKLSKAVRNVYRKFADAVKQAILEGKDAPAAIKALAPDAASAISATLREIGEASAKRHLARYEIRAKRMDLGGKAFNPDQPRDDQGRWGEGAGGGVDREVASDKRRIEKRMSAIKAQIAENPVAQLESLRSGLAEVQSRLASLDAQANAARERYAAAKKRLEELKAIRRGKAESDAPDKELTAAIADLKRILTEYDKLHDMLDALERQAGMQPEGKAASKVVAGWGVVSERLKDALEKQAIELSDSTLETAGKTAVQAIEDVRMALGEEMLGEDSENTTRSMAEKVHERLWELADWQARRIAVTESSRAEHTAQILSAESSGIVKGFRLLPSDDACEMCQQYTDDGEPTGKSLYPFTSLSDAVAGMSSYEDRTLAPVHPHCRCTNIEVFLDEDAGAESGVPLPQNVPNQDDVNA